MSINASSISRLLAKAGFTRAETETTSTRGHRHYRYHPGFEVRKVTEEDRQWEQERLHTAVIVEYSAMDSDHIPLPGDEPKDADLRNEHLASYERALHEADYLVERGTGRYGATPVLLITGRLGVTVPACRDCQKFGNRKTPATQYRRFEMKDPIAGVIHEFYFPLCDHCVETSKSNKTAPYVPIAEVFTR
jgi:hypothetical protein